MVTRLVLDAHLHSHTSPHLPYRVRVSTTVTHTQQSTRTHTVVRFTCFITLFDFNIQLWLLHVRLCRRAVLRPAQGPGSQWPPALMARNWRLEILGSRKTPTTPPMRANPDAMPNAGMFPFPNSASHGPAPSAMITCRCRRTTPAAVSQHTLSISSSSVAALPLQSATHHWALQSSEY